MCDRESFEKIRDAIRDLQMQDAQQSEQIKTLFSVTERQGHQMLMQNRVLLSSVIGVLLIVVLALVYGALGQNGFNAVAKAAPHISAPTERHP